MITTLVSLLAIYKLSVAAEYENCGDSPLSDFCETITWQSNDTCSSVTRRYGLTTSELVYFNWAGGEYSNSEYCSFFTEGDHVCVTEPDYSDCGAYPFCVFEYPEYFCDSYTLDQNYITCQEICDMYGITMEEFKEWNRHNALSLRCWDDDWMLEEETYCVSKPNITDFTDCVSIAEAEDNSYYVSYYESLEFETIGPLITESVSIEESSTSTTTSNHATPSVDYENCGGSPISDFCNTITWRYNYTCSYVAQKFNLTVDKLVDYNWRRIGYSSYSNNYYCSMFTDGDHICITEPDYSDCGAFPVCVFEYPEYFCDSYTLEEDYMSCQDICDMFNITMEEFKDWNKHNKLPLRCWDQEWMLEDETYCISKPNITDFTDCVSIAEAENNPSYVSYYEDINTETIGPLYTSTSTTRTRRTSSRTRTSTATESASSQSEYENCGDSPLSDFCQTITWQDNYTCSYVADKYNLTISKLVDYNWQGGDYSNGYYCLLFTEGDHVCVTNPDYSECGAYPFCVFQYPEFFCDTYTLDRDYVTCEEICDMFNISMEEFKDWNRHNQLSLKCWDDEWMLEDETYCISKPNITNFTDCVSIAMEEHNPSNVVYFESFESEYIGPLVTLSDSNSTRRTSSSTRSSSRTRSSSSTRSSSRTRSSTSTGYSTRRTSTSTSTG